MRVLARVLRQLVRLFVDDGLLALFALAVVAAAAVASLLSGLWAGCVLLAGSLYGLFSSVTHRSR